MVMARDFELKLEQRGKLVQVRHIATNPIQLELNM